MEELWTCCEGPKESNQEGAGGGKELEVVEEEFVEVWG